MAELPLAPPPTRDEVEELIHEIERFLRQLPPGVPEVAPLTYPGSGFIVGGLLSTLPWWGVWLPPDKADEAAAHVLRGVDHLRAARTDKEALEQALAINTMDLSVMAKYAPTSPPPSPGPETMPSPSAVLAADLAALRRHVARIAIWERAHHRLVHEPLAEAQGRAETATIALGEATAGLGVQTRWAIRWIVEGVIPRLEHELRTTIQELRQAQQQANAELARELEHVAERLQQRIGDVVRWLTTEALPELERELRAERAVRRDADRALARGIATEAEARTGADAAILAELAPLTAWFGSFGLHTTQKVNRNENLIDQLEHLDWGNLLAFTSVPALVALITRLAPQVIGRAPEVLAGLEDAASSVLGGL